MPENEDKIKKLYDTFVSDGYDMESEEDFRKNLSDSTKRKAAYDALVKEGYEMEPFEEFENNIGFGTCCTNRTGVATYRTRKSRDDCQYKPYDAECGNTDTRRK